MYALSKTEQLDLSKFGQIDHLVFNINVTKNAFLINKTNS